MYTKRAELNWNRHSFFLMLVGLSASLPLIVTLEQRRFYLFTCMGFFAIALAGFIVPMLKEIKIKSTIHKAINLSLLTLSVGVFCFAVITKGNYKRDQNLLEDIKAIGAITAQQTISADQDLIYQYALVAYLARHYNVSLDFGKHGDYKHHLSYLGRKKDGRPVVNGNNYQLLKALE